MGPGFRPVLPFRGRGRGRRTAGRSACPVVGATGTPLHFPSSGKFRLYPCSSSPHKGHSPLRGPPFIGLGIKVPQKILPNWGQFRLFLPGGVTTYRFRKSPQSLGYGSNGGSEGFSVGRGQGCNNAMTPGCSLLFGCKFAILKDAAGTLYNVASFKPPCSSTSGFRSCGSGYPEFSSSLHSQCVRRSLVPGLF